MRELKVDQFWRCPQCRAELAGGQPASLSPPICRFGHSPKEMEQIVAEAFGSGGPE